MTTCARVRRGRGGYPRLSENNPFVVNKYGFLEFISTYRINNFYLDAKRQSVSKQLRQTLTHLDAKRLDVSYRKIKIKKIYIVDSSCSLRHLDGGIAPPVENSVEG